MILATISLTLMPLSLALSPTDAPRGLDLRVASFNVRFATADDGENRWEKRRDLLFATIRKLSPDVLGLQEALHDQLGEILKAVPGYESVGVGRDDGATKGELAPLLFRAERFRLAESGTFWLSDTPEVVASTSWGNKTTRVCTWARLIDKASSDVVVVFNVHLDHQSQRARERGVELVARKLLEHAKTAPALYIGDFNAAEDNPAVRYIKGELLRASSDGSTAPPALRLVDTFRVLHPDVKDVATFHAFTGRTQGSKIDYIFAPPEARVLEAEIVRESKDGKYPSDHFPVTARVVLPITARAR